MKIYTTIHDIQQHLLLSRNNGKTIGLVPTMGALHNGHLSLLQQAKQLTDETVCSIFVNPTQFTDPADLDKYPRPVATDIEKVEAIGCDLLFMPAVDEMYAANEHWHLDIGEIEHLLEGKYRPGHYQGVTQVVYKLFDVIKPHIAFFGQKDYQQYLIIHKMVRLLSLPVKLIMCPIVREETGLAMSSRNIHLDAEETAHALVLSKALNWVEAHFDITRVDDLSNKAVDMITNEPNVELDYFTIADGNTLQPADKTSTNIIALVAAKVGKTRLIDNVILG